MIPNIIFAQHNDNVVLIELAGEHGGRMNWRSNERLAMFKHKHKLTKFPINMIIWMLICLDTYHYPYMY